MFNRTKTIKACMESQAIAHKAISIFETALILEDLSASDGLVAGAREEFLRAAGTCRRAANEFVEVAEEIAEEGGHPLPPDIQDRIKTFRRKRGGR